MRLVRTICGNVATDHGCHGWLGEATHLVLELCTLKLSGVHKQRQKRDAALLVHVPPKRVRRPLILEKLNRPNFQGGHVSQKPTALVVRSQCETDQLAVQ